MDIIEAIEALQELERLRAENAALQAANAALLTNDMKDLIVQQAASMTECLNDLNVKLTMETAALRESLEWLLDNMAASPDWHKYCWVCGALIAHGHKDSCPWLKARRQCKLLEEPCT